MYGVIALLGLSSLASSSTSSYPFSDFFCLKSLALTASVLFDYDPLVSTDLAE